MHWKYAEIKSRYLSGAPSVMVELGPGAGANLRYLPRGTRLIAIEPNLKMHALLRRGAKKYGIELDLRGLAGEDLDLPSKSVDFIFSSLVLCSVENPEKVIAEVPETDLKTKQNLQAKLDELAKLDDTADPTGEKRRSLQETILVGLGKDPRVDKYQVIDNPTGEKDPTTGRDITNKALFTTRTEQFVNAPGSKAVQKLPPGTVKQVGTVGGRPVYEDGQGRRFQG